MAEAREGLAVQAAGVPGDPVAVVLEDPAAAIVNPLASYGVNSAGEDAGRIFLSCNQ